MTLATDCLEYAHRVARKADDIEEAAAALGVEVQHVSCAGRELAYANMGETYAQTVCAGGGKYWIGSWGDWLENVESDYCERENVIRCGWCSAFTPNNEDDWHDIRCESCGHGVDGSD